ncbi:two-component system, OmpR family, sensor histidine kinase CreC [Pseudoalteromonas rubra]|uniref:histidine kinase n=1 Tax=Pseudoalteromonas rubra TaxID=43658 RepID=A0A8T0CAZ0_9GAMM|nr:two-component system sensor histidine kinase CreC [Pseudoalteromonas rubra]KAF7787907.1 two-component system, OmpR family, sensor histidine kinase CreC [Pseudoalteromonas rubra]
MTARHWPRIPLGLRFFMLYLILVLLTTYVISNTMLREIKPTIRQATEETLVDMANLLAVVVAEDLAQGTTSNSRLVELMKVYGQREVDAAIWGIEKTNMSHRIYLTDNRGIVVADSWQQDVGTDFSQWNDVYLTLRGEYGARSSATDPDDPLSTVMHVAAPVIYQDQIIGSLTVAKANRSVQPFIEHSQQRIVKWLALLSLLALLIGALIAWRINSAVSKLADYARKMGQGEQADKPQFRVFYEYRQLSDAVEQMRNQLDGKVYIEQYVETLTHELKSPLSGIKGASELLQMPLSDDKRHQFAHNIERETQRMQQLIDRLLELARLEQLPTLNTRQSVSVAPLLHQCEQILAHRVLQKSVTFTTTQAQISTIYGDPFLLQQALLNLLENALDFVPSHGEIGLSVTSAGDTVSFSIYNTGPAIPDYALPRLCERFYSLPRANGAKSTGLGLNFVERVAKLHQGKLTIDNRAQGVEATLTMKIP